MWAFITDDSWWIRAIIGGLFGALLFAAVPGLWRMSKNEPPQNPPIVVTPPSPTPAPGKEAVVNKKEGHRGNEWVKVDHFSLKSEAASRSAPSVEGIPRPADHRHDAA